MANDIFFHQMGLDERIVKAIAKLGWDSPTSIQEKAIPLCLEGKDILARAKTGSGKTASYAIPCVQKVLESKKAGDDCPCVKVVVLVPTKELSLQATKNIKELCTSCSREVSVLGVSNSMNVSSQRTALLERPDIVVGTPSRVQAHLQSKALDIRDSLQLLVVDEADLVFSFGYEEDIKSITSYLPPVYQAVLMSATLTEDVLSLKKLMLNNPVILKLEESDLPEQSRLTQFHIKCSDDDRYLLIYTLLKLRLVRGKTLLFVNDIQKCYKLKLFLEQFSIKSCVLNSELPHNSRCHVVEQFNKGLYDYVVATDELPESMSSSSSSNPLEGKSGRVAGRKRKRKDMEYGVSRGIDFQGVENVVNFDFPLTVDSYIHRVGRTARGFDYGTALTFVSPNQESILEELQETLRRKCSDGEEVTVKPYRFRMSEIEGFRYRVQDALRKVSQLAIREARLKEIRSEMLTSEKLKSHFEDNPRDLQVLRHDKTLLPQRVQQHLKYIPPYLVPKIIRTAGTNEESGAMKIQSNHKPKKGLQKASERKGRNERQKKRVRKNDPLKSLKVYTAKRKDGERKMKKIKA